MVLPDHGLRRLRVVALLLERGPGGFIGEHDSAAVHLPGVEQLRPPSPFPAASRCVHGRRWRWRAAAGGSARDGAPDGEVAILLWVVVEPRQLFGRHVAGAAVGTEADERRRRSGLGISSRKDERAQDHGPFQFSS